MADQAQIRDSTGGPSWLEKNKKKVTGWAVFGFGFIVIAWTVFGPGPHPKAATQPAPVMQTAPATKEDLARMQQYLDSQQKEAKRLQAAQAALVNTGAQPDGKQPANTNGSATEQKTNTAPLASAAPSQPEDSGFLIVGADGKNSGVTPVPQQSRDMQTIIDQQKELLKKSIDQESTLWRQNDSQAHQGVTTTNRQPQAEPAENKDAVEGDVPPGPRYVVMEGQIIPCILANRIEGEYAGPVKAVVAEDVYSKDLKHRVIPRGALVIGEASPVSTNQQKRIATGFHRLEMPDGKYTVNLDKFTGLDQVGATALPGKVNTHLLSALLWSLPIGAISGLTMSGANVGYNANGMDVYKMGVAQSTGQTANQILSRKTQVLPTITVKEGTRIEVWVNHDLTLPEYQQ